MSNIKWFCIQLYSFFLIDVLLSIFRVKLLENGHRSIRKKKKKKKNEFFFRLAACRKTNIFINVLHNLNENSYFAMFPLNGWSRFFFLYGNNDKLANIKSFSVRMPTVHHLCGRRKWDPDIFVKGFFWFARVEGICCEFYLFFRE